MEFRDRTTTRKGDIGEAIGQRILIADGWIPYQPPPNLNKGHPIDRLVLMRGNLRAFACDMKAKPKRVLFNDTGIDVPKRDEYIELCHVHSLDCLLIFVDEDERRAYYAFLLAELEPHRCIKHEGKWLDYPRTEWCRNKSTGVVSEIRFYPVIAFRHHAPLTDDECAKLQLFSTRDPRYQAMAEERQKQPRFL